MHEFRWNEWNANHVWEHGIEPAQAQHLVNHPARGFPRYMGDGRFLVQGSEADGLYMQVIYIFSPPEVVYVIHARPLTELEKRRFRRRR